MGCVNACICSGRCSDSCYEPESYCGKAEDFYDGLHGKGREQDDYYRNLEKEYYREYLKAEEDEYYINMAKGILADENSSDFEKEQAKEYLIKMGVYNN